MSLPLTQPLRSPPLAWALAALALTGLVLSPLVSLGHAALQGSGELWPHLLEYVLPQAVLQTAGLLAGVGLAVTLIGTGAAWLVAAYDFPGRRLLEIGLLLPLAVPTYIVAFAYLDLLHPLGPVQSGLRDLLGIASPRDLRLPELRSLPGCILLLGFVLYPYVYLPTRALFLMQAANLLEAARTLGHSPRAVFARVALPMARPAVALGTSLALMEALNDIGAAEFLGVRTLTVQVYATWINRSDLPGAAQIALVMLLVVIGLVVAERWARRGRGFAGTAQRPRSLTRTRLRGPHAAAAFLLGLAPVALGFLIPAGYLAASAAGRIARAGLPETLPAEIFSTVLYAGAATLIAGAVGFVVAASPRLIARRAGTALIRVASLGYALPGTILAIGLLGPLATADSALAAASTAVFGAAPALIGLGTGGALVTAYLLRFLAVAIGTCEAGLSRVPGSLPDAARMLGRGPVATLARVQLPLTWPALVSGALLVFVDCVKELPATLLLRPLNVETLATHLYGEAARGTYEDGAVAALLIVLVGLIPVAILLRLGSRSPQLR
ncbi:iron(III) transport system permease protein [Methylobacterium sp. BE186]|uniref:ABC transporter permease n=1 Tax=Methylobacterium sp. BE186 TaxID=2817715 RepID=UPI00285B87B6|nr:iron ABC transporter permease [Methylobacterium sp. BE186]MDR7038679.1 iron(III) transport system permease protein [Methylobacterium sp. BE186]